MLYLIATFDVDAFRIDTVKYVAPAMVETFCNAIREFALSIGKRNFFTFGEIYDDEATIERFVGRNSTNTDGSAWTPRWTSHSSMSCRPWPKALRMWLHPPGLRQP